jgi:uncharacterized protein
MRIGLLSDTHIPESADALPVEVLDAFRGVDLILHAGDIYILDVLNDLERIAPVLAASGDDDYGTTLVDRRVKMTHVLDVAGKKLWLGHQRHQLRMQTLHEHADIIVFGHEHRTVKEQIGGTLYLNPGSPTYLDYQRGLGTICILTIESGQTKVDIIKLGHQHKKAG